MVRTMTTTMMTMMRRRKMKTRKKINVLVSVVTPNVPVV